MKKYLLLNLLVIGCVATGVSQTVRRVNNNTGISGTNVYSTFTAAHTAAAANDIIIVEPSTTSYGDVTVTKPLKIYGNGYNLNTNTELKVDQRSSVFGSIDFNTGSGGSEIYGVTAGNFAIFGVSNITISRNTFSYISLYSQNKANTTQTSVSNIFISRNFMGYINQSAATGFTISNVSVNNNIIGYMSASSDPHVQNWVVRNNTFTDGNTIGLINSVFENNLLLVNKPISFSNVTYSYNISVGPSFPSENNFNKNNYVIAPVNDDGQAVSQLLGTGTGISADEQYQIKAGADLKTRGNGNTEVGAYGGSTPYIVSGIPPIPSIVNMINSGSGDNSNPLKVTISVKSNN